MSALTGTVVAATSATILYVNRTGAPNTLLMTTHGNSADIYVGSSTVTASSNGVVLAKSTLTEITVPAGETIYCAGNGTDTVNWLTFN
jgi:hypothetical protein